jgi:heat shock protein HspQ
MFNPMTIGQKTTMKTAKFPIGKIVRHRLFPFRGVIFDVDPEFANTEDWWQSIPEEIRPAKDQPFYHVLAENDENHYVAYVSEQNLLVDTSDEPVTHPGIETLFSQFDETLQRYVGHGQSRPCLH